MDCFVEFYSIADAQIAVDRRNNHVLVHRRVFVSLSTQEDLLKNLFPRWKGQWKCNRPILSDGMVSSNSHLQGYVFAEELNEILKHARTHRVGYDFLLIIVSFRKEVPPTSLRMFNKYRSEGTVRTFSPDD